MKKIRYFFYPSVNTYVYNIPLSLAHERIHKILTTKLNMWSTQDIKGSFINDDSFVVNLISPANTKGVKYSSTLVGKIIESKNNSIEIRLTCKPSLAVYIMFFLAIVLGFISCFKLIQDFTFGNLISCVLIFIGGPWLSIWIANISGAALDDRYKTYLDSALEN